MAVLVIMLTTGLGFTNDYRWASRALVYEQQHREESYEAANGYTNKPQMGDPAICYMNLSPLAFDSPYVTHERTMARGSMIVSILLIILGFFSRIIKLYGLFATKIFVRTRKAINSRCRGCLRYLFRKCCDGRPQYSLMRLLCYRPVLAFFLWMQFMFDISSSVLFEVSDAINSESCSR